MPIRLADIAAFRDVIDQRRREHEEAERLRFAAWDLLREQQLAGARTETDRLREELRAAQSGRSVCRTCGMWWRNDLGHPNCPPTTEDAVRDRTAPRRTPPLVSLPTLEVLDDATQRQCGRCDEWFPASAGAYGCPCRVDEDVEIETIVTGAGDRIDIGRRIPEPRPPTGPVFLPPPPPVRLSANPVDDLTDIDRAYLASLDYTTAPPPTPGRPYDLATLFAWLDGAAPHQRFVAFLAFVMVLAVVASTLALWIAGIAA